MKILRTASLLLASGAAAVSSGHAMTFLSTVVGGRPGIVATGQITMDTPAAFAAIPPSASRVYLSSPGGNVGAALQLGSLFRRRGVTAVVAGVTQDGTVTRGGCFSACVYAFVGASRRIVPGGSRVGIHRMQAATEDIVGAEERSEHRAAASMLMGYTARMGVDPAMIAAAEGTPSLSIHVLTSGELRRWRLAGAR